MNVYQRIYEVLVNEASKKKAGRKHPRDMTANELYTASQQEERRVRDLGGPARPRKSGEIRNTDPGMPGSDPGYGGLPRWPRGTGPRH